MHKTTILGSDRSEILIISKIESQNITSCINAKTKEITNKLNKRIKISFRQVNQFVPFQNKASFHFIGISDQILLVGRKLKIVVYVITNGKKEKKDADCILKTYTTLNSNDQNYGQSDFSCEVNTEGKPEDIEIISSDDIMGIDENLEDYQKSPNKTDEKIRNTKNEPSLGKVLNYSDTTALNDIPPTLEIESINFSDCRDKGKIKVLGKFSKKINKKFDFTIPFSYPSSSFKCIAPKIDGDRLVTMDCKVQKDFYNIEDFLIEPRIIKKKHQEVLYIKQFSKNFIKENCTNYNTIQKIIEDEKYNMNYTFLQTSHFKPLPNLGGIFFRIFIYSLLNHNHYFPQIIPINIFTRKRLYSLRNLDEPQGEQEESINCTKDGGVDNKIKGYNCTSENIKVDNYSEFESFYFESDNIQGIYEENSNPIETDININNSIVSDYQNVEFSEIIFSTTSIDSGKKELNITEISNGETNCPNNGTLIIEGNPDKNFKSQIKNFEIHFSNPLHCEVVCNFTDDNKKMKCLNKEEFEEETIKINSQFLLNSNILFNKLISNDSFTCAVSSNLSEFYNQDEGNQTEIEEKISNRYYNKKSSKGLGGGAIAAIVVICSVVLIGLGVLIALIKNGIIFSSKPVNTSTTMPPIINSSANIV